MLSNVDVVNVVNFAEKAQSVLATTKSFTGKGRITCFEFVQVRVCTPILFENVYCLTRGMLVAHPTISFATKNTKDQIKIIRCHRNLCRPVEQECSPQFWCLA